MGRKRIYVSAAERQKAYRGRARGAIPAVPLPPRRAPPSSRPLRLVAGEKSLRKLLEEYEAWLDRLPESLAGSGQAEKLTDTIEKLTTATDLLADIDPPLGFGRD